MTTKTACLVSVGHYTKLIVPVEKISAVLALLRDCPLVRSEWTGNENVLVKSDDKVEVVMDEHTFVDRDTFDAICAAERADKETSEAE